jgi:hypothetical protein
MIPSGSDSITVWQMFGSRTLNGRFTSNVPASTGIGKSSSCSLSDMYSDLCRTNDGGSARETKQRHHDQAGQGRAGQGRAPAIAIYLILFILIVTADAVEIKIALLLWRATREPTSLGPAWN